MSTALEISMIMERNGHFKTSITFEEITEAVCRYFETTLTKLKKKCRKHDRVRPRQFIMLLAVLFTDKTLVEIGDYFEADHSTVMHARDTLKDLIETDDNTNRDYIAICQLLGVDPAKIELIKRKKIKVVRIFKHTPVKKLVIERPIAIYSNHSPMRIASPGN